MPSDESVPASIVYVPTFSPEALVRAPTSLSSPTRPSALYVSAGSLSPYVFTKSLALTVITLALIVSCADSCKITE